MRPLPVTYVRSKGAMSTRQFGPKMHGHITVGDPCIACGEPLAAGDYTCLIPLGPGNDAEAQERARESRYYNAVAIEIHWSCATGEPNEAVALETT
jgi:hypothetical protein